RRAHEEIPRTVSCPARDSLKNKLGHHGSVSGTSRGGRRFFSCYKEKTMKITRVTLATALALSASLAIASGARANDAARGGPSSHRLYSPSGVTPGVISPDGTAGMDRGGFY